MKNLSFKAAPFSWHRNHIYTPFYTGIYLYTCSWVNGDIFQSIGGKFENFEYFLFLFLVFLLHNHYWVSNIIFYTIQHCQSEKQFLQ